MDNLEIRMGAVVVFRDYADDLLRATVERVLFDGRDSALAGFGGRRLAVFETEKGAVVVLRVKEASLGEGDPEMVGHVAATVDEAAKLLRPADSLDLKALLATGWAKVREV